MKGRRGADPSTSLPRAINSARRCTARRSSRRIAREADIRSDIYSLGCVLFHALAGQPPFEDRGAVRLVISHATEPPPRLATLNVGVPAGLQAVLDSMLAKDPALRFPMPGHAAQQLRGFLLPK